MVPEKTLEAVREKAERLGGGISLGKDGALLTGTAVQKALAYCQRRDVPEDMEQAAAMLVLALYGALPRASSESGGEDPGNGGENPGNAGENPGNAGEDAGESAGNGGTADGTENGGAGLDWSALLSAGAVKSIQRGDTAITFNTSEKAGEALSSALRSSGGAYPTVAEALAGLAPWRRLGRLRPEEEKREPEAEGHD